MKLNMKQGFMRLLLIVSYLIGILMGVETFFYDEVNLSDGGAMVNLLFVFVGIVPVAIFIVGYVSALIVVALFKWVKSGFLKGGKDE